MEKINICFFSGDITRSGGTERVAAIIANKLNENEKYNISFVSLYEEQKNTFFQLNKGIKRFTLYEKKVRGTTHILGFINRLKKIVIKNKIDVIIDIDGIIDLYSVPVKWMTKVKLISWEHFNLFHHPCQKKRDSVRKFAVKHVDAIVTLTNQDKENYLNNLKIKCIIKAIYNPVNNTSSNHVYNVQSKKIISVGRLTYQKGFERLIEVAEIVLKRYPQWEWNIYGEGEDREKLQQMINEKKLQENVILRGNVSNINKMYEESSMFVMTSRFEGLPMTLLEAKYYNLPLVSFDIETGPRECILDGLNGFLVKDGDITTMSDRICYLINDDTLRKNFSEHQMDDTDKFNLESIIKDWENLIEEVINNG